MGVLIEARQSSKRSNPFRPTKKQFWFWFSKINKEIFDSKVKKFRKVTFQKCRFMWAQSSSVQLWSNHNPKRYLYYVDLIMKDSYPSKRLFVEVLAHEMIHAYQYQFHDEMTHGKTFWEWEEKFRKHNLTLSEHIGVISKSGLNAPKTLA